MTYVQIDDTWYYTENPAEVASARQEGYAVSDTLPAGGTFGGVAVNPDIPTEQWALDYLLRTGQLRDAMNQTAINRGQLGVNAGQLGVNAFNAQAALVGNVIQAYPAFRGPNNWAQYANFVTGTPGAGMPQFLAAAANQAGGLNYGTLPLGGVEPLRMGDVTDLMQPSKRQSAGKTLTDAIVAGGDAPQSQRAGQQGAAALPHGAGTVPGPSDASGGTTAAAGGGTASVNPAPYAFQTGRNNAAGPAAIAMGDPRTWTPTVSTAPRNAAGKVDTSAYARTDVSGSGSSKISHVNKSHNLIEKYGYGHGSDARNAAHKAAGMTGEEFDRIVKHGGDPFKQTHAAEGLARVVTGPTTERLGNTTLHTGEGGADELHIVIPLERPDQPIPGWALQLANALSPDKDRMRGAGGITRMAEGGELVVTPRTPGAYHPHAGAPGQSALPQTLPADVYHPHVGATGQPALPNTPAPERAIAPQNLPRAGGAPMAGGGYGGGSSVAPAPGVTPAIDPVLLGKAARWWAAQHGGSAADGLAALQLPENAAYLESALGMAGAGEIDAILGAERPAVAPAPAVVDPGVTRDDAWRRAYLAQQAQGARDLAAGDYAGAVMGGVNTGLALAPGRVTTAVTPVHLAQGGVVVTPSDPATPPMAMSPDAMPPGGMAMGRADVGGLDPTDPHPSPEALIEIRAELEAPPAANPTPLEHAIRANWTLDGHGHPAFIGATTPDRAMHGGVPGWARPAGADDSLHMARGGLAVIDAGGTITPGNKAFSGSGTKAVYTNASGQIRAPSRKAGKFTTIPAWQGSPLAQPTTANASVMNRILATPSLKQAMDSTWGARGLIPEDMWAVYLNGLKLLGNAPAAGRIGAGF